MAINKVNNIAYASFAKFTNVTADNLGKMQNVSKPSSGSGGGAITYVPFDNLTFDNSGDSITGLKGKQTYSVSNNSNNTTCLTSTAARGGKALDLASARSLDIVASNWNPNLTTDDFTDNGHFTFSFWYRSNSLTGYRPAWVYQAYNFHIQIEVRSSYVRFVHKTTSTGFRSAYVWISQSADTWYHYAVSLDPTNENMHCYVNGGNKVTLNHADIGTVITPVGWQNPQNHGIVDEVAFFDAVLSDANIAKLYSDGGDTPPDLSGLDFY